MKKQITVVLGIILIIISILSFMALGGLRSPLTTIFSISIFLNLLRLIAGLIALFAAYKGIPKLTNLYGQIFGVIFALLTIFGFLSMLDTYLSPTMADNIFHLILATVLLYVGFAEDEPVEPTVD